LAGLAGNGADRAGYLKRKIGSRVKGFDDACST
jgi:hypothetical protein